MGYSYTQPNEALNNRLNLGNYTQIHAVMENQSELERYEKMILEELQKPPKWKVFNKNHLQDYKESEFTGYQIMSCLSTADFILACRDDNLDLPVLISTWLNLISF